MKKFNLKYLFFLGLIILFGIFIWGIVIYQKSKQVPPIPSYDEQSNKILKNCFLKSNNLWSTCYYNVFTGRIISWDDKLGPRLVHRGDAINLKINLPLILRQNSSRFPSVSDTFHLCLKTSFLDDIKSLSISIPFSQGSVPNNIRVLCSDLIKLEQIGELNLTASIPGGPYNSHFTFEVLALNSQDFESNNIISASEKGLSLYSTEFAYSQ